jgi:hypothetical protein
LQKRISLGVSASAQIISVLCGFRSAAWALLWKFGSGFRYGFLLELDAHWLLSHSPTTFVIESRSTPNALLSVTGWLAGQVTGGMIDTCAICAEVRPLVVLVPCTLD